MSNNFETAVDAFLRQIGQPTFRATQLDRIWKGFMAFCMCLMVEAFRSRGYAISPQNHANGFLFKCFPRGHPNNYSYFRVDHGDIHYEIRLSVDSKNLQYSCISLTLNLDVVVLLPNSLDQQGLVDSQNGLVSFAECKNLNGFPELVATFEGMVYELQRNRFRADSQVQTAYVMPCCLFLSGSGRSLQFKNRYFQNRRISLRIYDSLQPGNAGLNNFIQNWF